MEMAPECTQEEGWSGASAAEVGAATVERPDAGTGSTESTEPMLAVGGGGEEAAPAFPLSSASILEAERPAEAAPAPPLSSASVLEVEPPSEASLPHASPGNAEVEAAAGALAVLSAAAPVATAPTPVVPAPAALVLVPVEDGSNSAEEAPSTGPPSAGKPPQIPEGLRLSQPPEGLRQEGIGDEDVDHDVSPIVVYGGDKLPASQSRKPAVVAEPKEVRTANSGGCGRGMDPGDQDPTSRARDLISRELLDELSHEPDDWNEGRLAPTPPLAGFETPSETPSPWGSPRHQQQQYYGAIANHHEVQNEGLMCIDQWDWKTDAPEFIPGSMKGLVDTTGTAGNGQATAWAMPAATPATGRGGPDGLGPDGARLTHVRAQYEWQLRSKSDELREMQNRMNQLEIETAQVRASWEIERRSLVRQISHYRAVLERYCIPLEEAGGANFGGSDEGAQGRYYSGFEPSAPSQWGSNSCVGSGGHSGGPCGGQSQGTAYNASGPGGYPGGPGGFPGSGTGGPGGGLGGFADGSGCGSTGPAAASEHHHAGYPGPQPAPAQPTAYGNGLTSGGRHSATAQRGRLDRGRQGGGGVADAAQPPSSLDSKMQQLNSLLQEGNVQNQRRRPSSDAVLENDQLPRDSKNGNEATGGGYSSGSIASTLRAMFPHATIRTSRNENGSDDKEPHGPEDLSVDGSPEAEAWLVEQQLRRLERSTACQVDDRALRSLQALAAKDAREALQKVEELLQSQGGHCRNLSSILQSICRKIEKRSGRAGKQHEEETPRGWSGGGAASTATGSGAAGANGRGGAGSGGAATSVGDSSRTKRVRRMDEDGDAFEDSSESEGEGGAKGRRRPEPPVLERQDSSQGGPHASDEVVLMRTTSQQSQNSNLLDTPAGKRSWADIQSGDEDDLREEQPVLDAALSPGGGGTNEPDEAPATNPGEEGEHWTAQRVDKAARRGFDLRRRGDHWDLKISMGGLDPPFTEAGMERYCRWLRGRLTSFREEHGPEPLRRCRGEVDFSHNNMSNQMVWMLLETLAMHEVHTALLKLFGNHISQGGVLAICEFIRMNERSEALQELHLSHNEIDDESALELLRTLYSQRPRYPPRRSGENSSEYTLAPVWLRLNHNRIRDAEHVRRSAEAAGITICTAWDRQACGTSKCCRRECPLVHLYSFNLQARRRQQSPPRQSQSTQQPPSETEEASANGTDPRLLRRKRNRKTGGSKEHKKDREGAAEEVSAGGTGECVGGSSSGQEAGPPSCSGGPVQGKAADSVAPSAPPRILRRESDAQ